MPEITVSMAAGRTDEQKAGMMRDITQALVKNLGVDADAVVPGCASWRRPGTHNHHREYGFRARAPRAPE